MRIYLVRHAQKENEGENPPLTKKGIKQARYLAKKLKKKKFDDFYSSDMNRTKQTSEIVSKEIKIKPKIEKSLNEYESSDIKQEKSKWNKEERKRLKKMLEFLDEILKNPKQKKNILIIAHGITNRIIFSYLLNIPMKRTIVFRQDETCTNILKYSEKFENWRLVRLNDNHHLPKKLK
jgi:phosphoserine phosphatase